MLYEARQHKDDITYTVAPADALPFPDGAFDLATAFSAFHWFSDDASVNEIKRILKQNGVFAVVNKNDTSGIRNDVVQFFTPYIDTPTGKEGYDPTVVLASHFATVDEMSFPSEELFGLEDGIEYLQSIALWNFVPEAEKPHVLETIRNHFVAEHRREGVLKRHIETKLVLCKNA